MSTDDSVETRNVGRRTLRYGGVLVVVALLVSVAAPASTGAVAAQSTDSTPTDSQFVVNLTDDGDARVTLATSFDLTTDSEQAAFQRLQSNETVRDQRTSQFADRMRDIAERASSETGRSMQIHDPAMTFTTHNDTGIVALSVAWDGLATQDGDQLLVSEPFDSDFTTDQRFRITGPDGYELSAANPSPTNQEQMTASWATGTDFEGFEATFAPAETQTATATDTPGENGPGFGIVLAVLAVLAGTLLAARAR